MISETVVYFEVNLNNQNNKIKAVVNKTAFRYVYKALI